MSARPSPYRLLVLLLAAALPATPAWSVSIGQIQVHSFLGQPLLATVPLTLDDQENLTQLDCIKTSAINDELAGPGTLGAEVIVNGNKASIHLRGTESLSEPLVGLKLSLGCGEFISTRAYTLLVDPAPIAPMASDQPSPTVTSKAATPNLTPAPIKVRPIRPVPTKKKTNITPPKPVIASATSASSGASGMQNASQAASSNYSLKIETASATDMREEDLQNELQVLQNQHAQLRVEMTRLEDRMSALQAELENKTLGAAASLPATPVSAVVASAPIQTNNRPIWLWIAGGGLTAILLAAAAWVLARRNDDEEEAQADWLSNPIVKEDNPDTITSAKAVSVPNSGIEVADDDSELDQAQFFLTEGQLLAAIDLLYDVIDKEPKEIRAWLMLFRALSMRDSRQEFASLAERFKTTKPEPEDWDIVMAMGYDLEPDNPLYFRSEERIAQQEQRASSQGQTILDFFSQPSSKREVSPAPKLDIGLEKLPEDSVPGESSLNQISRRDAA